MLTENEKGGVNMDGQAVTRENAAEVLIDLAQKLRETFPHEISNDGKKIKWMSNDRKCRRGVQLFPHKTIFNINMQSGFEVCDNHGVPYAMLRPFLGYIDGGFRYGTPRPLETESRMLCDYQLDFIASFQEEIYKLIEGKTQGQSSDLDVLRQSQKEKGMIHSGASVDADKAMTIRT